MIKGGLCQQEFDLDERSPLRLSCPHIICKQCLTEDLKQCPTCYHSIDTPPQPHNLVIALLSGSEEINNLFLEAVQAGDENAVRCCLIARIDLNIPDQYDRTAIDHAAYHGFAEILRDLLDAGAQQTMITLSLACCEEVPRSKVDVVRVLLERQADPNKTGRDFDLPMFCALRRARDDGVFRLLLDNGARLDVRDRQGSTLLHRCRRAAIGEMLINCGAEVNARDLQGCTPLFGASLEMMKLLLARGCDPKATNSQGQTALHWQHQRPLIPCYELLLDHGALINALDHQRRSALHYACLVDQTGDIIRLLVTRGAELQVADADGRRPIDLAHKTLSPSSRELLVVRERQKLKKRDSEDEEIESTESCCSIM